MIYFAISKKKYKKVYNKKNSKISKKFSIIITEYLLVGRVRRHSPSPCSSDRDCTTHHCHSSSEKPYCDHTRGHCECARTEQVLPHSKHLLISISVCLFVFVLYFVLLFYYLFSLPLLKVMLIKFISFIIDPGILLNCLSFSVHLIVEQRVPPFSDS